MEDYFNAEQTSQNFEDPAPQRPTALTIACVFSFINAGWQILMNIISFLFYNVMQNLGQDEDYLEMMEKFVPDIDEFGAVMQQQLSISRVSYLLFALLFAGSFIGVCYMWKLQKKGFHIYTISQILILIATTLLIANVIGVSILGSAISTFVWIGIYFIFYNKKMQ